MDIFKWVFYLLPSLKSAFVKRVRQARNSAPRRLSLSGAVLVLIAIPIIAATTYYLNAFHDDAMRRGREIKLSGDIAQLSYAKGAVGACIDSAKDRLALRKKYCEEAQRVYRKSHSPILTQGDLEQRLKSGEYRTMLLDIENQLAMLGEDGLYNSPPTFAQQMLTVLLSKYAFALTAAVLLLSGALLYRYWFKKSRQTDLLRMQFLNFNFQSSCKSKKRRTIGKLRTA